MLILSGTGKINFYFISAKKVSISIALLCISHIVLSLQQGTALVGCSCRQRGGTLGSFDIIKGHVKSIRVLTNFRLLPARFADRIQTLADGVCLLESCLSHESSAYWPTAWKFKSRSIFINVTLRICDIPGIGWLWPWKGCEKCYQIGHTKHAYT